MVVLWALAACLGGAGVGLVFGAVFYQIRANW